MQVDEVFKQVDSSKDGLTEKEAQERLNTYGENVLKEKNKKVLLKFL